MHLLDGSYFAELKTSAKQSKNAIPNHRKAYSHLYFMAFFSLCVRGVTFHNDLRLYRMIINFRHESAHFRACKQQQAMLYSENSARFVPVSHCPVV